MKVKTVHARIWTVVLAANVSLLLPPQSEAQSFTVVHSFGKTLSYTNGATPINADGVWPGDLIVDGNTLYGTTTSGGSTGLGTIFKMNLDGTGFTTLHVFTSDEGWNPNGQLLLWSNTLYGTTVSGGGAATYGTIFALNRDGTGFRKLYQFTGGADGGYPYAELVLSGNTLYGTTSENAGSIFAINTDSTSFTTLYGFSYVDGAGPSGGLVLADNTLYGATVSGGTFGEGTCFALQTDGTGFTTLYNFTGEQDGDAPYARLILSSNILYGAVRDGAVSNRGALFRVNTTGTGFLTLHTFDPDTNGAKPVASLTLSGKTLFGTTMQGGTSGVGTIFAVDTGGTAFTTLHNLAKTTDGAYPMSSLLLVGNDLYGTASEGGAGGNGTIFRYSMGPAEMPPLGVALSQTNLTFTWPQSTTGFVLQSTSDVGSPQSWTAVATAPTLINGQNTVTIPISGSQPFSFYRLHP